MTYSTVASSWDFTQYSKKHTLFLRCIVVQRQASNLSHGSADVPDFSIMFTPARELVVMKHYITYMVTLYCLNWRTLDQRLALVNRLNWPNMLGIPPVLITKWWDVCRAVEIYCNIEIPTILGHLELNYIFLRGVVPTSDQYHLRLRCPYMEKSLQHSELPNAIHNFLPKCLSKNPEVRAQSARLVRTLECNLYTPKLAAGGIYRYYDSYTGLPVQQYLQIENSDGLDEHWWHEILTETTAVRNAAKFEQTPAEMLIFYDHVPALPKTGKSSTAAIESKMDLHEFEETHGLNFAREASKFAQPHDASLSAAQRAEHMPLIDVDLLERHLELLDAQMKRGLEQGMLGDINLDFRLGADAGQGSGRQKRF